jgi:hypothetical protein
MCTSVDGLHILQGAHEIILSSDVVGILVCVSTVYDVHMTNDKITQ